MEDIENSEVQVQESTENTTQVDNQETTQAQEDGARVQPNSHDGKVEFTPEQQRRFNQVFAKASKAERELNEFKEIAAQQAQVLAELQKGQQTIVSHIQETNLADTESTLKQDRQAAYARGDFAAADEINDRLNDLRVEKKLAAERAKTQPKQQQIQHQAAISGDDVINTAVRSGSITENDAQAYRAWANEVDDSGNLVRPWVNEQDIRGSAAAIEGRAVFSNPSYANLPFAQKLMEIDKRMGVKMKTQQQSGVLPTGNLTRGSKNNNITLSPEIERVAVRTQFAGPGKSNQEHIDAYRKQLAQSRKGGR